MGSNRGYYYFTGRSANKAFTLIEVLVVVAIIALLISILLPSLKKAKDQARAAVCSSHLGSIAKAETSYQTSNREWIPGSPLTTGYYWAINYVSPNNPSWNPLRHSRFVLEWFDYATPLRVLMQGIKSMPSPTNAGIAAARNSLLMLLTSDVFNCPSNSQLAAPYTKDGGSAGPIIKAPSYLTMDTIMRGGPGVYIKGQASVGREYAAPGSDIGQAASWDVVVPSAYVPRHTRMGRESMKVFLADGLRFFNTTASGSEPPVTYNCAPAGTKGVLTATPPSTRSSANNREYVAAKEFSYRHGDGNRIDAVFFDGHVEGLTADVSSTDTAARPFTGKAIHPKNYYPSGSVVSTPSALHADFIPSGTVLP